MPTDKDQKSLNRQENLTSAQGHLWQLNTKDVQEISEVPEDSEGSELESRIWPHHFRTLPVGFCAVHLGYGAHARCVFLILTRGEILRCD